MILWAEMIKSGTHVKFLKRLGIALIPLPEPFTTPFGAALILIARHLSKRLETSRSKRLREMVRYYLAHTERFGDDADGEPGASGPLTGDALSREHAILGEITGGRSLEANLAPSVLQNWHDMRGRTVHYTTDMQSPYGCYQTADSFKVESGWSGTSGRAEKTIHHTINLKQLSQRYEGEVSTVVHSNWARNSGAGEGVTYHSLNMILLSQPPYTVNVAQTSVKHHDINMSLLRQRYGSAVSSTRVLNALRNNNFYYDIVSRGNVIGGY